METIKNDVVRAVAFSEEDALRIALAVEKIESIDITNRSDKFVLGDIVNLKSGGPDMTIGFIDNEGNILCQWFDGTKLKEKVTKTICLVKKTEEAIEKIKELEKENHKKFEETKELLNAWIEKQKEQND